MNNFAAKISVVLPTFNGSEYLSQSIASCLGQTYRNVELIIVDDGSTDETPYILGSYKDERIKQIRHDNNRGLPHALNSGFSAAKGDYLTWTSDDNIYAPDAFEKMVAYLEQSGFSFVYCDFYRFRNDETHNLTIDRLPEQADLKKGNRIGPCFLYTREVYTVIGDYDPDAILAEDYDYWVRVSKKFSISHLSEPLYFFREHAGSLYQSKYFEVKVADYLVRLKNRIADDEEVARLIINLLMEKKRDFFGINRKKLLSMYSAVIREQIEGLKSGKISSGDFRRKLEGMLHEAEEIGIDVTDSSKYLFVGVLDENLPNDVLLSSIDKLKNLILIETKSVNDEIKNRLRAKGVWIFTKNPITSLYCNLLSFAGKSAVVVQPFRKVKWFVSLLPFREKYWLSNGDLMKFGLWNLIYDEISMSIANVKRLVQLKIKRKRLMKIRKFPYEIGFPNDYSLLERAVKRETGDPRTPVSIVIPIYNRQEELERTLTGLTIQNYPRDLIEVIVADDGSSVSYQEIIGKYSGKLNLKYVKQDDQGYRLAAVRNMGIRESTNEVVILLDCDMIPVPGFVASHAKWFHACNENIVVVGDRGFIDPVGLEPIEIEKEMRGLFPTRRAMAPESIRDEEEPYLDWRIRHYKKTDFLKKSLDPYRYASGGNVSFRKSYAVKAGLFDEEFSFWGGEDIEFFYRMHLKGAYIIPDNSAGAFHQNHPDVAKREEGREITQNLLMRKIPVMREGVRKNGFVPRVSIYMPSYNSKKFISEAIESVIAQTYDDWELCICDDGSTDGTYEFLQEKYSNHEKIRIERIVHSGIGGASNRAVEMCRGEFVGQLDSDDMLKPEAVEITVDFLEKHPEFGVVYSDYEIINERGEFVCAGFSWPEYDPVILLESMIVHHFRLFRSIYWHRTPGFHREIKNAVDYDMYLKMSEVTNFSHVKTVLYRYRIHGDNTSVLDGQLQSENHLRVVREALARRRLSWEHRVDPTNKRKIVLS